MSAHCRMVVVLKCVIIRLVATFVPAEQDLSYSLMVERVPVCLISAEVYFIL